ncbi:isochorismatase family protein [Prosthecomicrobium pneumaticum]|uniref:Maleamate amidohydrolase n=1 Tax=Prosthecomicrobium pneumaticum TaxID=81895 RepID=A0A7W9CUN6_9HYPH|nr:isochorismatase family protein [Prosthecomicrobium pneumaticum]MBB5751921.1 maleamate amidohydrolase [Prosthecomicrobium pneumaticum]
MSEIDETAVYAAQGFGQSLGFEGPFALLIIDFVNGFADPATFGGGNIVAAVEATVPVLAHFRARNWPVAHTRIVFADDGSDANVFAAKVPSVLALTEAAPASAIVDALAPRPGELVVRKTLPSPFPGSGLAAWLVGKGVRTVVVAGCTTSGCVRAGVVDAMSCGFRPVVLEDCVGDRALGPHRANLFDIAQKYGDVVPSSAFLAAAG